MKGVKIIRQILECIIGTLHLNPLCLPLILFANMLYEGTVETNEIKSVKMLKEKRMRTMLHASKRDAIDQAAIPEKD